MFALELDGLAEATARLDAYPAALTAALSAKAADLAAKLADAVMNDKLSGGVLNAGSGALSTREGPGLRSSCVGRASKAADSGQISTTPRGTSCAIGPTRVAALDRH